MAVWKIADTQAVLTLKAAHTRRRQKKPSGNGGAATETATSWSSDQPIQIFFTRPSTTTIDILLVRIQA